MASATAAASTLLLGSLSANAAAACHRLSGSKSTLSVGPGRGKCNVGVATAEASDAGNSSRRELLLSGLAAGTILLPGGRVLAAPGAVPTPDFNKCQTAYGTDSKLWPFECCPPAPQNGLVDFKPDARLKQRVRVPLHTLGDKEIARLRKAYAVMKSLPESDPRSFTAQAEVHCQYCNGAFPLVDGPEGTTEQIHFNWLFFPFHRAQLYYHERILASFVDDDSFAIPFWNWDNQRVKDLANVIPEFFQITADESNSLWDKYRNPDHLKPDGKYQLLSLRYNGSVEYGDEDEVRGGNISIMYNSVAKVLTPREFFGIPYYSDGTNGTSDPQGSATLGGGTVENGPHNAAHYFGAEKITFESGGEDDKVFRDLGNFATAGYDPLFYHLHSNVDRLWSVWNKLPADEDSLGRKVKRVPLANGRFRGDNYRKNFDDPRFLNAAFLFYDEQAQLQKITVADTLDHASSLKYDYADVATDAAWINYGKLLKATDIDDTDAADAKAQEYLKDILTNPRKGFKGRRGAPGGPESRGLAGKVADVAEDVVGEIREFRSRRARGFKDENLSDKPYTVRVFPEPIPDELKSLDFYDLEATLVLEDVRVPVQGTVAFNVFLNLPTADLSTSLATPEYIGSYSTLPAGKFGGLTGKYRRVDVSFPISANLELLGIKSADRLIVTIVPESTDTEKGVKLKGITITWS